MTVRAAALWRSCVVVSLAGGLRGVLPPPDPVPLRLTPTLLRRLTAVMAELRRDPAHLRRLTADTTHTVPVRRHLGPFRESLSRFNGLGTVDTLLDIGAAASTDPAIAAAFAHAHLAPAQYLPFVAALQWARATDRLQLLTLEDEEVPLRPTAGTDVHWQNVAFLRAHRVALDALELPVPAAEPASGRHAIHLFLDTLPVPHLRRVADDGNAHEPYPWGYQDSADASPEARAEASPHARADTSPEASDMSTTRAATRPWRVLFVGNSLTYVNSLPRLFSHLAAQGLHRPVVVGLVSLPGATPYLLWYRTDLRQVLAALPWDVVVVQLRPSDGRADYQHTRQTFPYYVHLFTAAIAAQHARPVFWTQWGYPPAIDSFYTPAEQTFVHTTLNAAAKAAGTLVVPIPQAFAQVRQQDAATWRTLFRSATDPHPSALGSYLAAVVLYRTLTGRSPVGLPRTVNGVQVELPQLPGTPLDLHTTDSLTIPAATAALLQHAAVDAPR